jgi:ankyrin repeat protein
MRLSNTIIRFRNVCKLGLQLLVICLGMIAMTTNAAPSFKLKAPGDYFSDPRSLALLSAARAGDVVKAKQLVADGANPNDDGPKDNQNNRLRLLHYAIAANDARAVRTLVAVGADVELNAQGFGEGPLFAIVLDNVEMLSVLLDLRPVDKLSRSTLNALLFRSVALNRPRCLELLFKRGAPIDFPNGAGDTVMMDAMDAQDYELAEWLLLQGASIRIESKGGMTPAYLVQFHLQKFTPGSPTYNKVLHLKELMEARGAVFPALSPKEIRAQRGQK